MKRIISPTITLIIALSTLPFMSCTQSDGNQQSASSSQVEGGILMTEISPNPSSKEASVSSNIGTMSTQLEKGTQAPITVTVKGSIHPEVWKPGETATIEFSGFPKNATELQAVQEQYGNRPDVAVLLELMAFEIYNHDKEEGKNCLEIVNVTNNVSSVEQILKDRYNPQYGDYYTPFLVATYLEGASPENAYKVNHPFTIKVRSHKVNKYQDSNSLKGTVLYLEVYSSGYDTPWRGISVTKQKGCPYYKAVNCPALYTQCKPVSFKIDEEYTDIWLQ